MKISINNSIMDSWEFRFRLIISIIVILLTLCFSIYPAFISVRVALDPSFRKAEVNHYTYKMFYENSIRYDNWAQKYLHSHYANKVSLDSVSETEWPMFGSVFYLLTAEELKPKLIRMNTGESKKILKQLEISSESAAQIIADPNTATWVQNLWGKDYLHKENVFYRMMLIMGLTSYENISGKTTYRALLLDQTTTFAQALSDAKYHLLDDYPGECYPNDVLWGTAAILRADKILGTNHQELGKQLMQVLNTITITDLGVPPFLANPKQGTARGTARGSGNSGILNFAPELDPVIAKQWYKNHEKYFWWDNGYCRGFRENQIGLPEIFNDVDSGPVIKGYGAAATVFGIGAARMQGRLDHALPMTQEIIVCSWPTPFGLLVPQLIGAAIVKSRPLGETAFLFAATRPVPSEITPYTAHTPPFIWLVFLIYFVPGILIIFLEYYHWKKWLKKLNQPTT